MIRFLSRRRSKTPATATPPVTGSQYTRPGGGVYHRPDGVSIYERP